MVRLGRTRNPPHLAGACALHTCPVCPVGLPRVALARSSNAPLGLTCALCCHPGIGFVLAFLLNLLLPEDKVSPDDGKEFEFESATSQAKAYSSATSSATPASTA